MYVTVYNTVVDVWCDDGFRFPDNQTHKVIWCMEFGIWNDSIENCTGYLF